MEAAVLIADLKESRKMSRQERMEAQDRLGEIVDYFINPVFDKELLARVRFSAGDSVQGVFKSARDAINCYLMIKAMLYPFEIRCGVGVGEVIGLDVYEDTNRLDGEAYHHASRAVELCKDEGLGILFISGTRDDALVNQFFSNAWLLESRQNRKRKVIAGAILLLDPIAEPALLRQYKKSSLKAFSGILSYYGEKTGQSLSGRQLEDMLSTKPHKTDESAPILARRVVNSSLQRGLSRMLGLTAENMRQMISKSGINEIKKCYMCAATLADRILKKER